MLFSEADDPLRALRWSLAEIRRCLGDDASIDGDPVFLRLSENVVVDVDLLSREWVGAVETVGLGAELLDGLVVRGAPAFESWLLYERRRVAAASEAILHEAALGLLARGALDRACGFAVRAAAMSPLDENYQALLIRLYRLSGDDAAAERQYAAWTELLETELGVAPGVTIEAAMRERPRERVGVPTSATVEAAIESGSATIAAGAIEPGVAALRSAVRLADAGGTTLLRSRSRQVLAEALIHSLRGLDEEGLAHLHEADRLATEDDNPIGSALARAELGYVDFLRARYDRAELWLREAMNLADGSPVVMAKAATYLGSVHSDTANYPQAIALLDLAGLLSREAGDPRREAYALCMKGRVELLRGDLDGADHHLATAVALAERVHWLSFLPWPQAFQGEVCLARNDPLRAAEIFQQAFARACQLGDPCWEGITARGLALVADAAGDIRASLRDPARRPRPEHPTRGSVRVARRPHPRRDVRARPQAWALRDPNMDRHAPRARLQDRDAGADRTRPSPLGCARQYGRRRRCRPARGTDRQPRAARSHARRTRLSTRSRISSVIGSMDCGYRGKVTHRLLVGMRGDSCSRQRWWGVPLRQCDLMTRSPSRLRRRRGCAGRTP